MPNRQPLTEAQLKTYNRLKELRASTTVSLRPTPMLRDRVVGLDGEEHPFSLRYYQVQGVFHMLSLKRMVLGDDTGLGKCQPYDSLVLTEHGLIRMGEIEDWSNMEPDTFRPMSRPFHVIVDGERRRVKNFYNGGIQSTIKATTRYGFENTGTLVHPMLVLREGRHQWVQAREWKEGDFVCIERRKMQFPSKEPRLPKGPGPKSMTPSLARFLGYYVGEGSLTSKYTVHATQSPRVNPEIHADIVRLFKHNFGKVPHRLNIQELLLNDVKLRRWLASIELDYTLSADRGVPSCIFQATEASSREFLRALFEGEGHISETHIEYSTASEELGRQIQIMLLRFGIVARRAPKYVKGRVYTYWKLTICGDDARQFQKEIGFISSRKQKALRLCVDRPSNPNHDVIPEVQWVLEKVREDLRVATSKRGANRKRDGSGLKQFGVSFVNTLNNIRNYGRAPTYAFLTKAAELLRKHAPGSEAISLLQDYLSSWYFYDPIETLEDGEDAVFDIEVDHPSHAFVSNGVVNHNTLETIATLCYLWEKEPNNKIIVIATKSAIRQWAAEIQRFTKGIRVFLASDGETRKGESPVEARKRIYEAWANTPASEHPVLILNYALLVRDWNHGGFQPPKKSGKLPKQPVKPGLLDEITAKQCQNLVVIFDEAAAFKEMRTKTWEISQFLSDRAHRSYGLTATLLKNNLMEGFCIFKVIRPDLFGTKTKFLEDYCVVKLQEIGRKRIPLVMGYRNIDHFRETIDPFILGRKKHTVAKELPALTTREIRFDLSGAEDQKYGEALSGVLELGDGEVRDFEDTKALTSLIYCQQVVNSLALLRFQEGSEVGAFSVSDMEHVSHKIEALSSKEQALVDLLTDELDDEKVIIFTRFERLVGRLQTVLQREGIKSARITGKEKDKERAAAQTAFQDLKSDTKVIFITAAGSEAINLQAAVATIFFDAPWSWGDFLQILGRMIRIGSLNQRVLAFHLIAERPNRKDKKTIDDHVIAMLRKKKALIDQVLGEAAVGALKFDKADTGVRGLLKLMQGKALGGVERDA